MNALVESVKDKGVNQPAIVRPLESGGYEIIAGHRRQKAIELAGCAEMPCIERAMTDDEAILSLPLSRWRSAEYVPSVATSTAYSIVRSEQQQPRRAHDIDR